MIIVLKHRARGGKTRLETRRADDEGTQDGERRNRAAALTAGDEGVLKHYAMPLRTWLAKAFKEETIVMSGRASLV